MKNIFSVFTILALAIALCLTPASAVAQTTTTVTTLSAALNATSTTVRLTAATGVTGFTNGQPTVWLYVDREFMPVYSISGTTAIVQRNGGGAGGAHASGAKVWIGPYNAFLQGDPYGPCTATSIAYLPAISVPTGTVWNCGNSQWTALASYATRMTFGATLTAGATLTITNPAHMVSPITTTTVSTITANWLPGTGGCVTLIPTVAMTGFTTSVGGNIALASTAVASKALVMCFNPTTALWYPSY